MVKVSVIVASYNAENYIARCIESILGQTWKNLELIICDDNSKDNTILIIQKYMEKDNRIKLLKNTVNSRPAYSRNRCIQAAQGEYIAIQDADDYSDRERIEKQVKALESNQSYDFVGTGAFCFDEYGVWEKRIPSKEKPNKRDCLKNMPFIHASCMFRKEALDCIGGYKSSKELPRIEDYDMIFRLYSKDKCGFNLNECLYYYFDGKDAFMRKTYRDRIIEYKVRKNGYLILDKKFIGLIYCIKPLVVGLIPRRVMKIIKTGRI